MGENCEKGRWEKGDVTVLKIVRNGKVVKDNTKKQKKEKKDRK